MQASEFRLKRPVLLPFVIGSVVLFLILVVSIHREERDHVRHDFRSLRNSVGAVYTGLLRAGAERLGIALDGLARDPALAAAFEAHDRSRLLAVAAPRFDHLRDAFQVTHLYFHDPNRINFLRVHQPERHGDRIDRYTLLKAARTGTLAYGAELGPLGTFTLRVVLPWRVKGRLIGYLELGEEIEGVVADLAPIFKLDLTVLINKQYLSRSDWESGSRMLGRDADWDILPDDVVGYQTRSLLPTDSLSATMRTLADNPDAVTQIRLADRDYLIAGIPLLDAAKREVGHLLVMRDMTERIKESYGVVRIMVGASLIVGPLLLGLFWFVLNRAERQLMEWRRLLTEATRARMLAQEQHIRDLEHAALYDGLTGIANRKLLVDQLEFTVEQSLADGTPFALAMLNLQRISEINDTLGHDTGDTVLKQVADRLRKGLPQATTVARPGGDEFAVILPGVDSAAAKRAVDAIHATLAPTFHVDGIIIDMIAAVGVALFPQHGEDAVTLMRRADVAMRWAKHSRDHVAIYQRQLDPHSLRRLTLLGDLRAAIEDDLLRLRYQPQVTIEDECVVAAEALVQWNHPELGAITPDEFIPLAERTGLIRPLTRWAIRRALADQAEWLEAGHPITVCVNLSAHDLSDPALPQFVGEQIAACTGRPDKLILEVTESAVMHDAEQAVDILREFASMGIPLAIDDFGTGYSSLAYLKKMPVSELKVDRSFVSDMCQNPNDASIVASTINLAHTLGLVVVAEGIEDRATWDELARYGCDKVQGFFISPALAADDFIEWLESGRWHSEASRLLIDGSVV